MTTLAASAFVGGGLVTLLGTLLALRTPARASGVLFAPAGVVMGATGAWTAHGVSGTQVAIATMQVAALAAMAYPRLDFPDPATWAAALVVVAVPPVALAVGGASATTAWLCVVLLPATQVWWRLEAGQQTRPLLWLLTPMVVLTLAGGLVVLLGSDRALAVFLPAVALLPLAAWVGLAQPQVVDLRGVASMLAVNITAALGFFAALSLVSTLWAATTGSAMTLVELAVVAVGGSFLLEPLRRQLRLVGDDLLFGTRPDPLSAAGSLAGDIGADPVDAVEAVRSSLVLPYVALTVEGAPVTESGQLTDHLTSLPLSLDGQPVGELVVGLRAGDLRLPAADVKVLQLTGPLLAQTARAHALARHLQEAREAAATAREDERFRLRRDLHDGLGPRLAAIAFRVGAAQLKLAPEESRVAEHLARVRAEAVAAIREIRELVYGMRPPALDEVGLLEAIRLRADELRTPGGDPLRVELVAADLGDLPAAVEVAAYRIVVEALTNAARHSGCDHASARLVRHAAALVLEVRDGGTEAGEVGEWRPGVGIASMRERAQELGGTFSAADGVVRAELPLAS
ncbi:sensor histidine kinase [Spongisporangium articulatum]|uniref:histidine kinase n=1 Tax=Spongisporangium articulatum TaxID=3362603 RepID=A0ABW8ARK7_9ACTN